MLDLIWTRTKFLDISKLGAGVAMLATPLLLELGPAAKWDLWICGYAMATICVADLTAEADWEPRTSLWLGIWLAAAPGVLGFSDDPTATFLHLVAGSIVSLLSVAELWSVDHTPPRRFRPGGACHAQSLGFINDANAEETAGRPLLVRDRFVPSPRTNILERRKRASRPVPRSLSVRRKPRQGTAAYGRASIQANAQERAENLRAIVADVRSAGHTSVRDIAAELNRRAILTPRGREWHATSVVRLLERLAV
jgi:hypothetical protein